MHSVARDYKTAEPAKPPRPPRRRRQVGALGPKKFAEPVSLPSTTSADLPLPGTAFGTGFVLLALRARRKQHTNVLAGTVKGSEKVVCANCALFFFQQPASDSCNVTRVQKEVPREAGPKKFAEPVSLSSTVSADLPLPGTAFGLGFDLLALRARRKQHTNGCGKAVKGSKKDVAAICGNFIFQRFHSLSSNMWTRLWRGS
jgi:hypothetical protein